MGQIIISHTISNAETFTGTQADPLHIAVTTSGAILPAGTYQSAVVATYATIANRGVITAGAGGVGIVLTDGELINRATGTVAGGYNAYGAGGDGVQAQASAVVNYGSITGGRTNVYGATSGAGVVLDGGTLRNAAGASVAGATQSIGSIYAAGTGVIATNATVTNAGTVTGGAGFVAAAGVVLDGGAVNNAAGGLIIGGENTVAVPSAAGVQVYTGKLTNAGTILGGFGYYGNGGTGVVLGSGAIATNTGVIHGGNTYYNGFSPSQTGHGGNGVVLTGGATFTNRGLGEGGAPLVNIAHADNYYLQIGGAGIVSAGNDRIINSGTIIGVAVAPGVAAVNLSAGDQLTNSGLITGTYYSFGAEETNATITNTGVITGGTTSLGILGSGGAVINHGTVSGIQITQAGKLINTGIVAGQSGGNGLFLSDYQASGTLSATNSGTVTGSAGNDAAGSLASQTQLDGAVGVIEANTGTATVLLTNSGNIAGGAGADTGAGDGAAGAGGIGLQMFDTIGANSGTISGGAGGTAVDSVPAAAGGVGAVLYSGSVLTDSGTITGGAAGGGGLADAVQVSTGSTLILTSTASFNGLVQALDSTAVLGLGGSAAGTLQGLGSAFTGFATLATETGANWSIAGGAAQSASVTVQLAQGSRLSAGSVLDAAQIQFLGHDARLTETGTVTGTITGFGQGDAIDLQGVTANSLSFANGTLSLLDQGSVVATLNFVGERFTSDFTLREVQGGAVVGASAGGGAGFVRGATDGAPWIGGSHALAWLNR